MALEREIGGKQSMRCALSSQRSFASCACPSRSQTYSLSSFVLAVLEEMCPVTQKGLVESTPT